MVGRAPQCEALAQVQDAGLGAGVRGIRAAAAPQRRQRGHMDQLAVALLFHDGEHRLGDEEHGLQVDVHHPVPALQRDLLDGRGAGDAGHVDQDVDTAEEGPGLGDLFRDLLELRHVEFQCLGLAALGTEVIFHGLGGYGSPLRPGRGR